MIVLFFLVIFFNLREDLYLADVVLVVNLLPDIGDYLVYFVHLLLVNCADGILDGQAVDLDVS